MSNKARREHYSKLAEDKRLKRGQTLVSVPLPRYRFALHTEPARRQEKNEPGHFFVKPKWSYR